MYISCNEYTLLLSGKKLRYLVFLPLMKQKVVASVAWKLP